MRTNLRPLEIKKRLEGVSREDIAATAQRRLEEVLCEVVQNAVRKTGVKKVALAGGVFVPPVKTAEHYYPRNVQRQAARRQRVSGAESAAQIENTCPVIAILPFIHQNSIDIDVLLRPIIVTAA